MFARDLSEALFSEMVLKLGTIRTWGDGKRIKRAPHKWVRYRAGQGSGGQVRGDDEASERAHVERENLKSAVADLARDYKAGNLDKSLSFGKHVELAKRLLGRHSAALDSLVSSIRMLVPKGAPTKLGPCKIVKGKDMTGTRLLMVGCYDRVSGRVKTLSSTFGKLSRKHHKQRPNGDFDMDQPHLNRADKLTDMTGTRLLMEDSKGAVDAFERLKAKYGDRIVSSEDMITRPRHDGYRSIHAEFVDEDGLVKEIQIRTPNQQKWADWSHDIYKPTNAKQKAARSKIDSDPALKRQFNGYAVGASDYYAKIDEGGEPGQMPECPEILSTSPFGCLD